jgi:hypothetical protein
MKLKHLVWTLWAGLVMALAACNSGSGSASNTPSGAGAISSGVITAFGSVFVNNHEFSTVGATVIDDDSGAISTSTAGLEVGEVVDVDPASDSSSKAPVAGELHLHPLARGYVDASDITSGTLTVMGQTIQITTATSFSDHRACVSASNPCTPITGQSGLVATTGSGANAVAGTYVTVHGYLFNSTTSTANIVATLISAADVPPANSNGIVHFKAEGVVTAAAGNSITIGGLSVDLSNAKCFVAREKTGCNDTFSIGQVVSAYAAAAPSLPASSFAPDGARLSSKIPVDVSGSSVEIEGAVASVNTSAATFVVRGVNIDASALPTGTSLPAVGDIVRVLGTVAGDGESITATSLTVLHAALGASYGFEGDVSNIAAGAAANTYVLTLLGQTITVNSATRLADRSTKSWDREDAAINPFNINTFQSYLGAASQHLIVYAQADTSGNLTALSVIIVPPSTTAGVAGVVDSTPAPVNSATTGTPTTFDVHGIAVSADPAAVLQSRTPFATIAAGDQVVAVGTFSAGTLTVTASPSSTNMVIDLGQPSTTRGDFGDMGEF